MTKYKQTLTLEKIDPTAHYSLKKGDFVRVNGLLPSGSKFVIWIDVQYSDIQTIRGRIIARHRNNVVSIGDEIEVDHTHIADTIIADTIIL